MLVLRLAVAVAVAAALADYGCIELGWGGKGVVPALAVFLEVVYVVGQVWGSGLGQAVVFVGQVQVALDLFPLFVFSPAVLAGLSVVRKGTLFSILAQCWCCWG